MTPADFFSLRTATRADEAAIETLLGVSYPAHMGDPYDEGTLARALPRITRIVPALLDSGTFYAALATGGGPSLALPTLDNQHVSLACPRARPHALAPAYPRHFLSPYVLVCL